MPTENKPQHISTEMLAQALCINPASIRVGLCRNKGKHYLGLEPEYETHLRSAVWMLREGLAGVDQFNDLADTVDLLQLGIAIYDGQKPDEGAAIACEVSLLAMQSIRERYLSKGKFGATGEELKAVQLLADTSLDYWNRRSGALFAEAYRQLVAIRKRQGETARENERKAA